MEKGITSKGHCANHTTKQVGAINTDHTASLRRINRIKGQLEAVSRMIDERRYCPEILQQTKAISSALRGLEGEILRGHLRGCVAAAFDSKNTSERNDKIEEIVELFKQ